MRQCLIITGTIQPNSVLVAQKDVEHRRDEYVKALTFYLNNYNSPIYFIENSDYDFNKDEKFISLFNAENIQLLKHPQSKEFDKGKGFQEFEMLDKTIEKIGKQYDEVIKVTGRYIVANFNEIKGQKNNGFVIDQHKRNRVAITSFFKFLTKDYEKHVLGSYKDADDSKGVYIEHIIYQRLKHIPKNKISLFNRNPILKGVSGSYGGTLDRNPIKMKLRNFERKILKIIGRKEFLIEY